MDGMLVLPLHVLVYVSHDLLVVCLKDSHKDGLSIGMVDANSMAHGKVSQRGDVRPADSSIDMPSRLCKRFPSVRMNRGTAGVSKATSRRLLPIRVVQHQSSRMDAW